MTLTHTQQPRVSLVGCRGVFHSALLAVTLMLAGCASIPESIQSTGTDPITRLGPVALMPQDSVGHEARLGGRVVDVQNENDRTRLIIVSLPLDRWARPELDRISDGRFIAYVQGFLEPLDFRGRLVTVLGTVAGTEQGRIGAKPYRFVVIHASGYQRWNEVQQVMFPPGMMMDPWGWDGRYRRMWGGPNDWPGPVRVETIVTQ